MHSSFEERPLDAEHEVEAENCMVPAPGTRKTQAPGMIPL